MEETPIPRAPVTARLAVVSTLLLACWGNGIACAETPDDWVKLLSRVHGGFGAFLPVGIRIGEDAMKRLDAKPRKLSVLFYQGEGTPCPCAADGVMLAVSASPGQGTCKLRPRNQRPARSQWSSSNRARAVMV